MKRSEGDGILDVVIATKSLLYLHFSIMRYLLALGVRARGRGRAGKAILLRYCTVLSLGGG